MYKIIFIGSKQIIKVELFQMSKKIHRSGFVLWTFDLSCELFKPLFCKKFQIFFDSVAATLSKFKILTICAKLAKLLILVMI